MNAKTPRPTSLTARSTAAMLSMLLAAAGAANAQVTDTKIPLNYNFHGYVQTTEGVTGATNANADAILFRSIADRGLYWNPSDTHGWGTNPIIGTTGITYSLFDSLGYGNTTAANAAANGLDSVHLGSRVFNRGMETVANSSTQTGVFTAWAPIIEVSSLSSDGSAITGVTTTAHGLAVGQRINLAGANPTGFTGAFTVTGTPDTVTFTCIPISPFTVPAAGSATGSIFCNSTSTPLVTALSASGTTVTATTNWAHGFTATTNSVNITGSSIPEYNGLYVLATASGSTFTYTDPSSPTGTPTGTKIYLATCDHIGDQTTTLASPVTLDANTEIGVLYTISDSGGQFDAVLNFSDSTSTVARLACQDWTGTTNPPIISNKVSATGLIKHTVSGTTSSNFRAVQNNDTGSLLAFGSTSVQVAESVISVPKILATTGVNLAGKQLTSITFRNSFYNPTAITALSVSGGLATATVSSNAGFIPGMPIRIGGVLSNNAGNVREFDGDYKVDSLVGTNQFRFATGATGTASAKMFATGPAGSVQISSIAVAGTVPTATATVTTAAAHGFVTGDSVTIEGASNALENGTYTITFVSATSFTYTPQVTGTPSAQMQVTRSGVGRGYQVHATSVRTGTAVNPSCLSAINIPTTNAVGTDVVGSTSHATNSGGDPAASACGTADSAAVYYSYTASGNDPVALTVCAPFTSTISVYSGSCGALSSVACSATNTANCGGASGNSSSTVSFNATMGQTYYFRVSGQNGAMGNFTLNVKEFGNVNCTGAVPIVAGATSGVTLVSANTSTTPCGAAGNDKNAVWYQYTATGVGSHLVEARTCLNPSGVGNSAGSPTALPLDTTLAVYSDCSGGTPLACNDDGCSVTSRLQWMATGGSTYLIRVATKGTTVGAFTLTIDDPVNTDIPMPIQFNWNGICHGTYIDPNTSAVTSEQSVPISGSIGATNENRFNQNGYRSIADRSLLFDPNNSVKDALNYGGTIGYQGIQYQLYTTPLQADMVHLGNRTLAGGGRPWATAGTTWPAQGGTSTNLNGLRPLWLNNDDQTTDQTSSMASLSAVFGPNTKIGIIYHASNVTVGLTAKFDVTLRFTDSTQVVVTLNATDWFYNNTGVLADSPSSNGAGMERQQVLGIFHGTYNTDMGIDAASPNTVGPLKVDEAVISTASLQAMTVPFDPIGKTLSSITFGNVRSGNAAADNFSSAIGIFAATIRNPQSFNLNFGPSGVGTVTPNLLNAGGTGKMTVSVSRGSGSPNNITSVVVDASAIGLSPTFALNDSGTNGDTSPNDNTWSRSVSFPVNTVPNSFSLPFTVTDAQSRQVTGNIIFSVVAPAGAITPNPVTWGGTAKATFNFGTAGGIGSISVDGSPIGLSSFNLNDSGTNGDTTANDGVWSANFVVPNNTIATTYQLPFLITDTASNQASGNLSLTVIEPPPANDDCAGAIALVSGVPYTGNNSLATSNDGAAAAVCSPTNTQNIYKAVWFSFTTGPSDAGTWLFSSCGSGQDTVVTVFNAGVTCSGISDAANILACNDDAGQGCTGTAASATATLAANSTYLARFSSYGNVGGPYTMIVQPLITGACCNNTTGACTQTVSTSCTTGSSYQGDNVACPTTCAVVAVCCNNTSGACTSIYGGLCPSGTSQGSGLVCVANVTCPPSGACCNDTTGACTFVYGGSSCPTGTSFGQNSVCDAATCPVAGACCNNTTGACSFIYGGSCPTGTSGGANSVCDANTCPPVGTCCHAVTSQCIVLYGGLCPANSNFDGSATCNPSPCSPIAWACCFSDGSCLTLFQNDCGTHAGATWAAGQTCGVYICPSCTNVLANPGAEAGDMSGWTIDVNGGNGWQAGNNAGDVHSGSYYFATSYSLSSRHQMVDLTQFLTVVQLDAAPAISAGEWVHTRGDQGGQYYILIQLLAADGTTVIASFNDGTQTGLTQLPAGTPYQLVSTTFTGYGAGVRFLRFEDGGRDIAGWAGNYGTHFDDAFAGPTSVTSACCSSSGCSVISNADCITAGGTPQACGTSCSPSPCPATGVCCRGSTCTTAYTTAGACAAALDSVSITVQSKFVTTSSVCNTPVTIPGTLGNITSPCCYANYNHNSQLEVQDIFDFLNDWFAGKKGAIVGGDGTTGTLAVQNMTGSPARRARSSAATAPPAPSRSRTSSTSSTPGSPAAATKPPSASVPPRAWCLCTTPFFIGRATWRPRASGLCFRADFRYPSGCDPHSSGMGCPSAPRIRGPRGLRDRRSRVHRRSSGRRPAVAGGGNQRGGRPVQLHGRAPGFAHRYRARTSSVCARVNP